MTFKLNGRTTQSISVEYTAPSIPNIYFIPVRQEHTEECYLCMIFIVRQCLSTVLFSNVNNILL